MWAFLPFLPQGCSLTVGRGGYIFFTSVMGGELEIEEGDNVTITVQKKCLKFLIFSNSLVNRLMVTYAILEKRNPDTYFQYAY